MHTPSPKFFCPRCRSAYDVDTNFCGKCGADMHRASSLMYRRDDDGVEMRPPVHAPSEADDPWIGRLVDSRYRVLERIGHGGMGAVYKIEHERMGKIAAMKVLHRELSREREVVRRFRREAQAVSRLSHPNTVQVFDFGTAGGALYLVMEFVRGENLGLVIKRDGPMPFERASALFHQTCAALAEAHAIGIVHRDLKPENIIVTRTRDGGDFVKVLDFGLAKIQEREELAEVTESGSIVGTPYYMSPEQIRGEHVDARADIYSLGALMYRVLTGEPPFRAQSPVGVLTKHLTAELVPPSERRPDLAIDGRIDAIIGRAMEKLPADRYPTVDALRHDIEAAYSELTGDAQPVLTPSGQHLRKPARAGSGSGPVFRSAAVSLDIDYGIDPAQRLNREDIDHYERSIIRRRRVRLIGIPLVVVGAMAASGYYYFSRPTKPLSEEAEPNNGPDEATLIAPGAAVTGYLGKRISRSEPDKDCYRLSAAPAPDGSQALTVQVTALPNIDLTVQLFDATGKFITKADEGGVAGDEWIRNYRVDRPVIIVVTESPGGAMPMENVSDSYTLTATLSNADGATEIEPNEMDSNAVPLAPGKPIIGYLDRRGDVDAFRFTGPAGAYDLSVQGANNAPLRIRRGSKGAIDVRTARLELSEGEIIRIERDERSGDARAVPSASEPYTIELRPAR